MDAPAASQDEPPDVVAGKVPVIWLMGKTQAGKTSIAAALTGQGEAGIGQGFRRATTEATLLPWPPPPEPPVLLFLDTPGIGADADQAEAEAQAAMAQAETQAHVVLVAVRAEDRATAPVLTALRAVRRRHRTWPVIVAQTRLHDLYPPGTPHQVPYPYKGNSEDDRIPGVPYDLARALSDQRAAFSAIPGPAPVFVPVDLTRTEHGMEPRLYGAEALLTALGQALPETVATLRAMRNPLEGARLRIILPWATAAALSEAPPLPFFGLAGATTFQGLMLRAIAQRCDLSWDRHLAWRFISVLGPGIVSSAGLSAVARQVWKLVPVVGTAASAATTFAVTWAAGEAAMAMFSVLGRGDQPDPEAVRAAWRRGFDEAKGWWKRTRGNAA